MVDLLGPQAFGALLPSASRPAFTPANGGADPDTWARDCTDPATPDGTSFPAASFNMMLAQDRNAIRANQVPESNLDDFMIARAMRAQRANWYGPPAVAGTADAITLTPPANMAFASLADMIGVPHRFVAKGTNTIAAPNIAVLPLPPVTVTWLDGTALQPGDITTGRPYEVVYDGTAIRIMSPSYVRGKSVRATIVEKAASTTLTTGVLTTITNFGVTEFNDANVTVNLAAGTFTITEAGLYLIHNYAAFAGGVITNPYLATVISLGGGQVSNTAPNVATVPVYVPYVRKLTAGMVVTVQAQHDSGANRTISGHRLAIVRLGDS